VSADLARTPALLAAALSDDLFVDVAAILLISAAAGAIAAWLRQPLVVAFVAVGVIVGPSALGLVEPGSEFELLARIGIALLLFVVGLKLDLHVVRSLGPVAVLAGCAQVALTAAAGSLLALALGLTVDAALYVGIGLAFSSTIIVVKLLSDRREIDDLHGRLAVGILIVQDLIVVLVMIVVTATGETGESVGSTLVGVMAKGAALLAVLALLMRFALTPLLHGFARLPELLVLFAIAWAISVGATGEILGFGPEVGAFLAGVSLASTPYREAIASRLVTIRDFLLLFFFIDLGSQVDLGQVEEQLAVAVVLSAFVLVAKPLIVVALLGALRYRRRVSLETGLALAQISEFSLILAALGLRLGHIEEETAALLTMVALLTIAVSVFLFQQSDAISARLAPALGLFERRVPRPPDRVIAEPPPQVLVLGLGRYGEGIVEGLQQRGVSVLGVDFDPIALSRWEERGLRVVYGDVEDPDLLHTLPLPENGWIVSTIRRTDANLALLHALAHRYSGRVAVAAHRSGDVARLTQAGADRVLLPYASAAREVIDVLTSTPAVPQDAP
jgi:Kef-type K+ transport system membrane component KefB